MKSQIAFNTSSKQLDKRPNELKKLEYDINAGATATVYVQLHDFPSPVDLAAGLTAPANGSVPVKSWNSAAGSPNNYKDFTRGELSFKYGVFVCVSTTEATLTIGTGNNKFDMVSGELYESTLAIGTEQNVVDVSATIWNNPESHKLIRVVARNLEAGVRYLMLFASDLPANGDKPIQQWTLAANGDGAGGDIIELDFSSPVANGGLVPLSKTSAGVVQTGCSIGLSTTTGVFTQAAGAGMNLYSEYL